MFQLNDSLIAKIKEFVSLKSLKPQLVDGSVSNFCFLCSGGPINGCSYSCNNGCDGGCSGVCRDDCQTSCDDNCSQGCYGN